MKNFRYIIFACLLSFISVSLLGQNETILSDSVSLKKNLINSQNNVYSNSLLINDSTDTSYKAKNDSLNDILNSSPSETQYIYTKSDSIKIYYNYIDEFPFDSSYRRLIDTSLANFHLYDNQYDIDNFYITTGQAGHAHKSMKYEPNINPGFYFKDISFEKHILTKYNAKYYSGLKPYTSLFYMHGPGSDKDESYFKAEHNQKLGKTIVTGFDFDFLKAEGFYTRQEARDANFNGNFRFNTKDFRYGFLVAYYHSRVNVMENGGIVADSLLANKTYSNRKTIDVKISNATNLIKTGGWNFSQYFYFTKQGSEYRKNFAKLIHRFEFYRNRSVFEDKNPDYNNIYTSNFTNYTNYVFDSTVTKNVFNNIAFSTLDKRNKRKFQLEVGVNINYSNISYFTKIKNFEMPEPTSYNFDRLSLNRFGLYDITPYAKFHVNFAGLIIKPEAYFTLGSQNNADYLFGGNIEKLFGDFKIDMSFYSSANEAPWFFKKLYSTNFQWNNDFKKTFYNKAHLHLSYNFFDINAKYTLVNNFTYLDQNIHPQQSDKAINYLIVDTKLFFNIKYFDVGGYFAYQFVDNKDILRVPDFLGKIFFIYKQPLFQKKLMTHIGFDVVYNTPFYADAYMPSIRSFYLQDEVKTGNYPYINTYIRFQVKNARFFVKVNNVASGLFGYNYFSVPHHPMNDRQFKFGVSWYFHD